MKDILVRNMARVYLPDSFRKEVLSKYSYYKRGSPTPIISYRYKDGVAYLPLNMQKLQEVADLLNVGIIDERGQSNAPPKTFQINPAFSFRDYQREPADLLLKSIQSQKYGTFTAGCGTGKTLVLTYVKGVLGEKTLILIDQKNLVENWIESNRILWNEPTQILTSDTKELDGYNAIATFQLLHRNQDLLYRVKKEYGCLLLDEAHTVTAETFTRVLQQMDNRYRIATSATFFSKNLPVEVLEDCCGSNLYVTMTDPNALVPEVDFVNTYVDIPSDSPDCFANKTLPYLASNDKRNSLILDLVRKGIEEGRHIVVICITQAMAKYLADKASEFCVAEPYVGTSSRKKDLDIKTRFESGELRCVFTCKKLDKGTDFTIADMLINARPGNNEASIQQISGRVVRKKEGKPTPRIIDLVDRGRLVWAFAANRYKWYSKFNYTFSKNSYFFLDML